MRKSDKFKNIEEANKRLLENIPHDKEPHIKSAIAESLRDGDLNRLKVIYKGLPENWEDNYLINQLLDWIQN